MATKETYTIQAYNFCYMRFIIEKFAYNRYNNTAVIFFYGRIKLSTRNIYVEEGGRWELERKRRPLEWNLITSSPEECSLTTRLTYTTEYNRKRVKEEWEDPNIIVEAQSLRPSSQSSFFTSFSPVYCTRKLISGAKITGEKNDPKVGLGYCLTPEATKQRFH